jgi:hypothetical protein
MSPASRGRSSKGKGASGSRKQSKGARSGNPQLRAQQLEQQALVAERRRLIARAVDQNAELRRLQSQRDALIAQRDELTAELQARLERWGSAYTTEAFAAAGALTGLQDAAALAEATAELIADRMLAMRDEEGTGWAVPDWLDVLVSAAADDHSPATWFLLHGLAAISPPALSAEARAAIERRAASAPPSPSWLAGTLDLMIGTRARVFGDAYGLRYAVLVPGQYAGGPTRTYLLDIDLCPGYATIVTSGWHDGEDAALAAWAAAVGPSASGSQGQHGPDLVTEVTGSALGPQAVREQSAAAVSVLADLLPFVDDPDDVLLGEDDPRERVVALLRDSRIVADLAASLGRAGLDVPDPTAGYPERGQEWVQREAPAFLEWCAGHGVRQARQDVVEEFLDTWAIFTPERLLLACSPHRVVSFAAELGEEWADQDRLRLAWSLIEPWATYCLERTSLPEHLAGPVREAARTVTVAPQRTAARAVDTWKIAADETHPLVTA